MAATEFPDAPRVAVGAVVIHEGRILMVERAKAPSRGLWSVPGGSVELGESLAEAAEREVFEETGIRVEAGAIVHTFDSVVRDDSGRVRFHYVIVDLQARYLEGEPRAGCDASAAEWRDPVEATAADVSPKTVELLEKLGFCRARS